MLETIDEVERVIEDIGALEVPRIKVMNKIDRLEVPRPRIERDERGQVIEVWLSAETGQGLDQLNEALRELFGQTTVTRDLQLGPTDGPLRAMLFRVATILLDERDESGGWRMRVEGSPDRLRFLERRFGAADLSQWIGPDASVVP